MWCCAFESIHNVVRFKNSCRNKISKCVYALYVLCIQKIRYKSDFKIPHNGESWLNRASKLYITFMQNTLGQSASYFLKNTLKNAQ